MQLFKKSFMLKLGKVEKFSFGYAVLRLYAKFIHDCIFYKKVEYIGMENIPRDKPVLIAPNHQNALMDALAIIFAQNRQVVFLARSDIFKKKLIAKILFFLKILPVFRFRDGKENLKYNDAVYHKSIEVLKQRPVVIFPEATHIDKKHLRKLKKGIQRIAFMLEEESDFKADVHIIPTGIYYSNYWNFKSKLIVSFGKPLRVKDFEEDYKKDKVKAMVKLGNAMAEKIKSEIVHVEDLTYHDSYLLLAETCEDESAKALSIKPDSLRHKIKLQQDIIRKADLLKEQDPKTFEELQSNLKKYKTTLDKLKLKDRVVGQPFSMVRLLFNSFLLLLFLPVFIYGALTNIIPYNLPGLVTNKIKDRQFVSSINFVFGLLIYPIIYLLQALFVCFFTKSLLIYAAVFFSFPLFGVAAFMYSRLFVKTSANYRYKKIYNTENGKSLQKYRAAIIAIMKDLK